MAVFGGLKITNAGLNLDAKTQLGKQLKIKRIALGDGQLTSESMLTLKSLINETLSCEIKSIKVLSNNIAKVTFYLTNQELDTGFTWRELGVIAEDPDTKEEVLYCYGNARENGEYISAKNEQDLLELYVSVDIISSNASSITATIDESLVFATKQELEELELKIEGLTNYDDTEIKQILGLKADKTALETKANKKKTWTITADTNWSGTGPYTKTIAVEGMLATYIAKLYPVYSENSATREAEREAYNMISLIKSSDNAIELICDEDKPAIALNLRVEVDF